MRRHLDAANIQVAGPVWVLLMLFLEVISGAGASPHGIFDEVVEWHIAGRPGHPQGRFIPELSNSSLEGKRGHVGLHYGEWSVHCVSRPLQLLHRARSRELYPVHFSYLFLGLHPEQRLFEAPIGGLG